MLTPTCLPDLDYIFEPTLIFMPINLEHEPFILESHNTMWGKECEPLLFDLDSRVKDSGTNAPMNLN